MKTSLSQALKIKNRVAGQLANELNILKRENKVRSDKPRKTDLNLVQKNISALTEKLIDIKTQITTANIGIYNKLAEQEELKAFIKYLEGLDVSDDPMTLFVAGYQKEIPMNVFIDQHKVDRMKEQIQNQINSLQDEIDAYNATTQVELKD